MLLSVLMLHSGRDEEDYNEALEKVRVACIEGGKAGAVDFFLGGDLNIEFRLNKVDEDLHGLDSVDRYGCKDLNVEEVVRTRLPTRTN